MTTEFPADADYLAFTVNRGIYGVSHFDVVSIVDTPSATPLPHIPPEMRGIMLFREGGIPLFDLRVRFGSQTRRQETEALVETMGQRKQDHINWVEKLKDEVETGKPISVQTDPHQCAFGKWFDKFSSDNTNLTAYMHRFDEPHKKIHGLAVDVEKLIANNQLEQAKALIHQTENDVLARLLELFDGIGEIVRNYLREYAVVFENGGEMFGVAVDDINFFSKIKKVTYPLPKSISRGEYDMVQAIGRYRDETSGQENDIMLLDMGKLVNWNEDGQKNAWPVDHHP